MRTKPVFSEKTLAALRKSRILGIRSGTKHRFIGVWMVLVGRRLFIRSWQVADGGWYRAFIAQRRGSIVEFNIPGADLPRGKLNSLIDNH